MSPEGWAVVIAAVSLGIVQIIGAVFAGLAWYKGHQAVVTAAAVKTDLAVADRKIEGVAAGLVDANQAHAVAEADSKSRDTAIANDIVEVKKEMNGKMAELLRVTAESERAKGVKEGGDTARQHQPPLPPPLPFDAH